MKSYTKSIIIIVILMIINTYSLSIFKSLPENNVGELSQSMKINLNKTDEKVLNEMTEKILNDPELLKKFSSTNVTELNSLNEQDLMKLKYKNSTNIERINSSNKHYSNTTLNTTVKSEKIIMEKSILNKTQESIEDTFNSIISKIENPNFKTTKKLSKYQKQMKKIFDNNLKLLKQFNIQENQLFNVIDSVINNKKLFLRLPISAQNIISQAYQNEKFIKIIESIKYNNTKSNSDLVSSTISSVSFIDHNNKLGRKGVMTMINNEGNYQQVWVVSNDATFSIFGDSDHMDLIYSIKSNDVNIVDFINSSCFQITKKSDEIRNLKLEVRDKLKPKNFFNADKFEKSLSDMIDNKTLKNQITFKGKSINLNTLYKTKENAIVKELKSSGALKDFKSIFCLVNVSEKDIWIKSIKHHNFIE